MKQNNITADQMQSVFLSRGMVSTEAATLRIRIERGMMEPVRTAPSSPSQRDNRDNDQDPSSSRYRDTANITTKVKNPLKIFGLEIFNNSLISFTPNYKIAIHKYPEK